MPAETSVQQDELIDSFHPDLRELVIRILEGETIEQIAADEKTLFDDSDLTADQIRQMLQFEIRRINS